MAEYTYEDIIMDPDDPRLEGAIGKECYFSDYPKKLLNSAIYNLPEYLDCLTDIRKEGACTFVDKNGSGWTLIIIKKEEPYSERAKKWIKENNLKEGDYVKVVIKDKNKDDVWRSYWDIKIDETIGKTLRVGLINPTEGRIYLELDDIILECPYFVLEKTEPPKSKYVPFESIEEFIEAFDDHTHSDKDSIINTNLYLSGFWLKNIKRDNPVYKQVIAIQDVSVLIGTIEYLYPALLENFTFLDGTPCGKLMEETNG